MDRARVPTTSAVFLVELEPILRRQLFFLGAGSSERKINIEVREESSSVVVSFVVERVSFLLMPKKNKKRYTWATADDILCKMFVQQYDLGMMRIDF